MKDSRHPARPMFHNESDVDVTINPEDEFDAEEEEDYHMVTGANRQHHRQSSRNPNDTIGSLVDQNLSNSTTRPLDPVNQIAIAMEKLGKKNSYPLLFHAKTTTLPPSSFQKTVVGSPVDQPTAANTKYVD